jgi:hypothetical protein
MRRRALAVAEKERKTCETRHARTARALACSSTGAPAPMAFLEDMTEPFGIQILTG